MSFHSYMIRKHQKVQMNEKPTAVSIIHQSWRAYKEEVSSTTNITTNAIKSNGSSISHNRSHLRTSRYELEARLWYIELVETMDWIIVMESCRTRERRDLCATWLYNVLLGNSGSNVRAGFRNLWAEVAAAAQPQGWQASIKTGGAAGQVSAKTNRPKGQQKQPL